MLKKTSGQSGPLINDVEGHSHTRLFNCGEWDRLQISQNGQDGLVSIIIPCYGQAHFLPEAIETALRQTYAHIEIIVVDDGSLDDTEQVVSSYPGVKYLFQNNQGVSAARNAGLVRSNGRYVLFLDADDRLLPAAVQLGIDMFATYPDIALVYAPYLVINEFDFKLRPVPYVTVPNPYLELLKHNHIGNTGCALFQRWVFTAVGVFDRSVDAAADYDLYLRTARKFRIGSHPEPVMEYRRHNANMSNNSALMLKDTLNVLRKQLSYVNGNSELKEAYRRGRKFWKQAYGERLVDKFWNDLNECKLTESLRHLLVIVSYYPERFMLFVGRRLKNVLYQT